MPELVRIDQPAPGGGCQFRFELEPAVCCAIHARVFGAARSERPVGSDLDRFGDGECVFELHAEVAHSAIHFGVTEKQLHGSQVARLPIDLSDIVRRIECVP